MFRVLEYFTKAQLVYLANSLNCKFVSGVQIHEGMFQVAGLTLFLYVLYELVEGQEFSSVEFNLACDTKQQRCNVNLHYTGKKTHGHIFFSGKGCILQINGVTLPRWKCERMSMCVFLEKKSLLSITWLHQSTRLKYTPKLLDGCIEEGKLPGSWWLVWNKSFSLKCICT